MIVYCAQCHIIFEQTDNIKVCPVCRDTNQRFFDQKSYQYFKDKEFVRPELMQAAFISCLCRLRWTLRKSIILHCSYESDGHAPNSYHYTGQAVDFHVEGDTKGKGRQTRNFIDTWLGGMHYYPEWNTPGYHLDFGPFRRWV